MISSSFCQFEWLLLKGQSSWLQISYAMVVSTDTFETHIGEARLACLTKRMKTGLLHWPLTLTQMTLSPSSAATSQTNIGKFFQYKWHPCFSAKNQDGSSDTAPPYLYACQCQLPLFKEADISIACLTYFPKFFG